MVQLSWEANTVEQLFTFPLDLPNVPQICSHSYSQSDGQVFWQPAEE